MHKIVDGKRVELSEEERVAVEAEWKRNEENKEEPEPTVEEKVLCLQKSGMKDEQIAILFPQGKKFLNNNKPFRKKVGMV